MAYDPPQVTSEYFVYSLSLPSGSYLTAEFRSEPALTGQERGDEFQTFMDYMAAYPGGAQHFGTRKATTDAVCTPTPTTPA
jgi:hypothetical protein